MSLRSVRGPKIQVPRFAKASAAAKGAGTGAQAYGVRLWGLGLATKSGGRRLRDRTVPKPPWRNNSSEPQTPKPDPVHGLEFSADDADGRGSCGSPSAHIRVISGQISSSMSSAASCKIQLRFGGGSAPSGNLWSKFAEEIRFTPESPIFGYASTATPPAPPVAPWRDRPWAADSFCRASPQLAPALLPAPPRAGG